MFRNHRTLIGIVAVVVVGAITAVAAQQQTGQDGSIAALTNEVRLLRLSVEKSGQTQSQVQAMAVYLSAQQNRLTQTAGRTDALHRELATLAEHRSKLSQGVSTLQSLLSAPLSNETDRKPMEMQMADIKAQLAGIATQETDLRTRVASADAELQADLAQWTQMITRLEQLTRQ